MRTLGLRTSSAKLLASVAVLSLVMLVMLATASTPQGNDVGPSLALAPPEPGQSPVPPIAPPESPVGSAGFAAATDLLPCQLASGTPSPVHVGFPQSPLRLPTSGVVRVSAVFVDYSNTPATETTAETLARSWPQAEEYLESVSNGRVDFQLRARPGWLRMSKPSFEYGFAGRSPSFFQHRDFIAEAVALADPDFDFTGTDAIWVFGERTDPYTAVSPAFVPTSPVYAVRAEGDSVLITNGFTRLADWRDEATAGFDFGEVLAAHETLHNFGLADLYQYGARYPTLHQFVGEFDPMSSFFGGDYRDTASQSTYQSNELFAWHAWQLGWIDDDQVDCTESWVTSHELTPAHTVGGTKAAVVPVGPRKNIVVEARSPSRWDTDMARSGLLVYTVDAAIPSGGGPIKVQGSYPEDWPDGSVLLQPGENMIVDGYTVHAQDVTSGVFSAAISAPCTSEFSVGSELEYNAAVACYNAAAAGSTTTITLIDDVVFSTDSATIDNPTSDPQAKLVIDGTAHRLDANGSAHAVDIVNGHVDIANTEVIGAVGSGIEVSAGTLMVRESTITNNGVGVYATGSGTAAITNSTITGNTFGIHSDGSGSTAVSYATIADNTTGIVSESTTTLAASVLARNSAGDCDLSGAGAVVNGRGNVAEDGSCPALPATAGLGATLAALQEANGCVDPCTDTIALLFGSPAIDAVGSCNLAKDQRGEFRSDGLCDAGAYELAIDFDGDGFSTTGSLPDCDDGNDAVFPGAVEVPYNLVDDDCVDGDLVDVDGDGFDSVVVAGGDDCDDGNDAVFPGAVEVPYNLVDDDCVDGDLVDVDGDGFDSVVVAGGDDCDDGNDIVFPGAVEVPNNGVDEDCSGSDGVTCNGLLVTINMTLGVNGTGTPGDDVILGTPGDDVINALAGDDTVCAGDGDDVVVAGDGDDVVFGEGGRDILRGGPGADQVHGGDGDDRVLGGIGNDTMTGGEGDDYLGGFGGADTIDGGPGNERIFGGFGADTISGGPGNDVISGLIGDDTISGGPGTDRLDGDRGNDMISGGPGDDRIRGGNANDVLNGDDGDDDVSGGKADDALSGGLGTDTCAGNLEFVADTTDGTCETEFGIP